MAAHPPHDPDSADVALDALAMLQAHINGDPGGATAVMRAGCPECMTTMLANLFARALTDAMPPDQVTWCLDHWREQALSRVRG